MAQKRVRGGTQQVKATVNDGWFLLLWINIILVEVTLEKVYYGKLKFTIVNGAVSVTGIFQFTMVNSTLVNFHDYRGKNKDDPSPITIWLPKKNRWVYL